MGVEVAHVIGVHRVPFEMTSWFREGQTETKSENFRHLHLVELALPPLEDTLNPKRITQEEVGEEPIRWQIAYEVVFLDSTGTEVSEEAMGAPLRVVFFFHYLKLDKPLLTPHGPIPVGRESAMPGRLRRLVVYYPP